MSILEKVKEKCVTISRNVIIPVAAREKEGCGQVFIESPVHGIKAMKSRTKRIMSCVLTW